MKRNNCNNNDRNRPIFNHISNNISRNNLVAPEMLVNELWIQDEDTGVKIIEMNSSSDESEPRSKNFSHAWSYVNKGKFEEEEDDYKVNEEARNRRRMSLNENNFTTAYANHCYYDRDMQTNSNAFYSTYDPDINSSSVNHHMNCFTIINNQNIHSGSSTETENENEAYEIIELDNGDQNKWDHLYNEEVIMYDSIPQSEKRTVWIYSYKNKRLLSEDDFELVNIPSKENSSGSTTTSDEELRADKCTNACRLGSPIPTTYIPRLDLSLVQTLSTVTEVSEPNKSQPKKSLHEKINLKPRNNWLTERYDRITKKENSNVVNWMALSPRERRRRSINSDVTSKESVNETEVTHAEGIKKIDQVSIKSSAIQVQVDVHANETKSWREISVNKSSNLKSETIEIDKISNSVIPMNISIPFADADNDSDSKNLKIDYSRKPHIKLKSKVIKTEITDPIEKLNGSNWIAEDKVEEETAVYDYDVQPAAEINVKDSSSDHDCDSVSRRLWKKNMQLMKPAQWAEYLPITCSPPSLHLSLSIGSLSGKKTWCTRLAKLIKCCK